MSLTLHIAQNADNGFHFKQKCSNKNKTQVKKCDNKEFGYEWIGKRRKPPRLTINTFLNIIFSHLPGDDLNSFSFSPGLSKGSFSPVPAPQFPTTGAGGSLSMGQSWSFYNFVGGGQTGSTFPTTVRNPNKAILTIEARTTKVSVRQLYSRIEE